MSEITEIIEKELKFFESANQVEEIRNYLIKPQSKLFNWQYGDETHEVYEIAKNDKEQIVYCETGFGPSFPWATISLNTNDLGQDGSWNAYLYEAFITSSLFSGSVPDNFELKGLGERNKT